MNSLSDSETKTDTGTTQAFIEGDVNPNRGDFIGRDKHMQGDDVRRDKIEIGNLTIVNQKAAQSAKITLKIEGNIETFTKQDQERIQRIIAEVLNIKETVEIIKIAPGSILVTVALQPNEVLRLNDIVKSGRLKEYGIVDVNSMDLQGADLQRADLQGADLRLAKYDSATQWPEGFVYRTKGAIGPGASLRYANLQGADLQGANLQNVNLQSADLRGADLRGANLRGAGLRLAKYDSATQWPEGFVYRTKGAIGPGASLQYANLRGANLRGANLRGANLRGAGLRSANLRDTDLRDTDLQGADLQGADLRSANLRGADLQGADLQGANLRGADLRLAKYDSATQWPEGFVYRTKGAIGPGASLPGADLPGVNLRGASLQGVNLQGVNLQGADLRGANLRGADLRGANLRGANLRGANLESANVRGADLTLVESDIYTVWPDDLDSESVRYPVPVKW